MKKFFEKCGWGYVAMFAALVLVVILGSACMLVGLLGWFTGECDWAAYLGMSFGFLCTIGALLKFDEVKDEPRRLLSKE